MNKTAMACALLLAAGLAQAQTKLTPGLWEHQAKMKTGSGQMEAAMAQMQKQLAAMPPDKRKQVEEMMSRQGMGMPTAPGQAVPVKVCITPEQAALDETSTQDSDCKTTSRSRSGNTIKLTFECTGPRKGAGEGEYTLISSKEHKGRSKITSSSGNRQDTIEIEHHARWLAADCGGVKPRP
jgi:Protein of unknown function (DUF3617)